MMAEVRNISLWIAGWSGLIAMASGAVCAFAFRQSILMNAARGKREREADDEIGDISVDPGYLFYPPLLLLSGMILLLSLLGLGIGVTGLIAVGEMAAILNANPLTAFLFIVAAVLLYGVRSRYPFAYGFIEIVVGMSAIIFATITFRTPTGLSISQLLLTVSSGMYVIVRGLDNMSKSLPKSLVLLWKILRWEGGIALFAKGGLDDWVRAMVVDDRES